MLTFNEFYEILEASTRGVGGRLAPFIVHFKPDKEDENRNSLPATHPEIKEDVFSVYTGFLRQDIFKINYPHADKTTEKVSLEELKEIFETRSWKDFTAYKG